MYTYKISVMVLLLLALIMGACGVSKTVPENRPVLEVAKENPMIIFMVFSLEQDSLKGKNVLKLISKNKSEGLIKAASENQNNIPDFLGFELFEAGKVVLTFVQAHPLYQHLEYLDGDALKTKSLEFKKGTFFIRIQGKTGEAKIKVTEHLKNGQLIELGTFPI